MRSPLPHHQHQNLPLEQAEGVQQEDLREVLQGQAPLLGLPEQIQQRLRLYANRRHQT